MARVNEAAMRELRAQVRGELIEPGDARYDEARRVYNAMIDKRPALLVRAADVADVLYAVQFAREQRLLLAVRGGGHNGPGLGTCDDGLVIDLSRLRGIRVDPARRTARVEGGCTWGDVDHATHPFGLATPSGFISTTGVGGLTLGGGIGYLTRAHGLSIDNLVSADVVLADGRLVRAGAEENADLFWALRGGGGNFGLVTSFEFRLHPVSTVYGGPMLWPLEQAPEVMRFWRDFITSAPEDMNAWLGLITVPPAPPFPAPYQLKKMCALVWCYTGPLEQAEARFKRIRTFRPAVDFASPIPWPALQQLFDALYPPGLQWYWKADFFRELSDEAVDLYVQCAAKLPTMHSTVHLYPTSGAAHRPRPGDTAFSHRDANFSEVIVGVDPDPSNNERIIAWARECWQALHAHAMGGAYLNMVMDEGDAAVQAAYRDNYGRLAALKQKYDPSNLFRVNHNIAPAAR